MSDVSRLFASMQADLNLISNWMRFNKLTVNTAKSNYMIVGTTCMLNRMKQKNLLLRMNDNLLTSVNSYVYLGICIDATLSFQKALNLAYQSFGNKIYLLGQIRT